MRIYPEDLGLRRYGVVLNQRTGVGGHSPATVGQERRPGPLVRFWTRGLGLQPEEEDEAVRATRATITGTMTGLLSITAVTILPALGFVLGHHEPAALVTASGGLVSGVAAFYAPRAVLRRLIRTPVTVNDISTLCIKPVQDGDDLEKAYLTAVATAVQHDVPAEAQAGVRAALHSLGDAIDRLPAGSMKVIDTHALRSEAREVHDKAQGEPDAVVAASLGRRADALARSADASERAGVIVARTAALRDELLAQTNALNMAILGLTSGAVDVAGLSELAESVNAVAVHALAVGAARAELEEAVGPSVDIGPPPVQKDVRVQTQRR